MVGNDENGDALESTLKVQKLSFLRNYAQFLL